MTQGRFTEIRERPARPRTKRLACFECGGDATVGRRVWLKDQRIERRLCKGCLKTRGLHVLPNTKRGRNARGGGA